MRPRPKPPCPYPCEKRKVGCRSTCKEWIEYEADHFAWLKEKEEARRANEDVVMYQKDAFAKGVKQKRQNHR